METYYRVIGPGGTVVGTLPTPRLISEGGGEAWEDSPGHWRSRDDAYDAAHKPADVPYTRVRVARAEDWRVEVTLTVDDAGAPYTYDDWFHVVAVTRDEAQRLGLAAANDEAERRWDDANPIIHIDNIRQGVGLFG